ncbi:transposase [Treponema endosymbiont of Eucomonympha sp.]|uniref:transposase n=1 Tax=Treponema endosymbiont of Eucomonympha sp. TaxID=1580831 RepID=UPI0013922C02|nr:transposase [Treponema endosymbiont of Eucomonympha sp.]
MRTSTPWRDMPPKFGNRSSMHKRFAADGTADAAIGEPAGIFVSISSTCIKAHAGRMAAGEDISHAKGG